MRSGWVTVILLAATIVTALLVPTLRESFSERATQILSPTHGNYPPGSRLAEIAAENPQDARLWYGFAVASTRDHPPLTVEDASDAFDRAISLAPDDPAPRLSLALFEIDQAGIERLPQETLAEGEATQAATAAQLESVQRARELLNQVRELDPDNALADYLLAWTWLAESDTDRALEAASRGGSKQRWTMYDSQRAEALLALLDRTDVPDELVPMATISLNTYQTHAVGARLRSMTRAFRNVADDLRAEGRDESAIEVYELILQAGHLMRTEAHNLIDGLVGVAVTISTLTSDDWAPADEEQRIEADPTIDTSTLRVEQFSDYLRDHGRADLAEFAEREIAAAQAWNQQGRELPQQMLGQLVQDVAGGPVLHAAAIWGAAGSMLVVAALVGLLSLIARYWREPRTGIGWSHLHWLALLALLLIPGQVGAYVAKMKMVSRGVEAGGIVSVILGIGILVGGAAWVAVVLVLALRKRRALRADACLGRARTALGGVRALVLPTLAALILLSMPATYAIERNLEQMGERHRQLAVQGEVEYYGLDTGMMTRPQSGVQETDDAEGGQ